jgi:uncharacterized DUF497 family protein
MDRPLLFDFDPGKSRSNLAKHGIDFVGAQVLWLDEQMVEVEARTEVEPRSVVIAKIGAQHWSAVITYRGEAIRLISVRRSRAEEVDLYEGK